MNQAQSYDARPLDLVSRRRPSCSPRVCSDTSTLAQGNEHLARNTKTFTTVLRRQCDIDIQGLLEQVNTEHITNV